MAEANTALRTVPRLISGCVVVASVIAVRRIAQPQPVAAGQAAAFTRHLRRARTVRANSLATRCCSYRNREELHRPVINCVAIDGENSPALVPVPAPQSPSDSPGGLIQRP